jgi:lipoprotein-anchoring transpeptidase ErfK/SrfK
VRKLTLPVLALVLACGGASHPSRPALRHVLGVQVQRCSAGALLPLRTPKLAYAAVVKRRAVAFHAPGRGPLARFGKVNVNDYPTVFGVVGAVVRPDCTPTWYHVQLPMKPNGIVGFVRAADVALEAVPVRIVVDVSERRLTLYRRGKRVLTATVAVGSPSTPTPLGRFYVNQRLIPEDTNGPFGPGAIGISAFSNVLTGWAQGGPVAIHGTNEPWSIGKAVSNGCIRLPNATLRRVFRVAWAGTPVIIKA